MKIIKFFSLACLSLVFFACNDQAIDIDSPEEQNLASPMDAYMENDLAKKSNSKSESSTESTISAYMDEINEKLISEGENYRVVMAEYITADGSEEAGQTVLQKDVGNKQLSFDFVPNDVRRAWSGSSPNDITYAIDQTGDAVPPFGGLTAVETDAAIERGTSTWANENCSDLHLTRNPDYGVDIGLIAFLNGLGGSPFVFADVQHCGWGDINFPGGVLGATFTFGFTEGGEFTDIDNNGKLDTAFREIYYDPSWNWADDDITNVDVESVATHEIGHGLSQAHFGNLNLKNDGRFQASPKAVMNAFYGGPFRDLTGADTAGHCSNWTAWPNN